MILFERKSLKIVYWSTCSKIELTNVVGIVANWIQIGKVKLWSVNWPKSKIFSNFYVLLIHLQFTVCFFTYVTLVLYYISCLLHWYMWIIWSLGLVRYERTTRITNWMCDDFFLQVSKCINTDLGRLDMVSKAFHRN